MNRQQTNFVEEKTSFVRLLFEKFKDLFAQVSFLKKVRQRGIAVSSGHFEFIVRPTKRRHDEGS